jgi:diguanylate cyclase (GGDEF)-like protein/PAS domain S-box-containing protein
MRSQLDIDHPSTGAQRAADESNLLRLEWLAAIVESSSDAVVGVGRGGVIESWNRSAECLYGHSAARAIGQPASMLVPPEHRAYRQHALTRVLSGETEFVHDETEDLRADGTRVAVMLTGSPIRDESGAIVGIALIAHDITDRKRLERELKFNSDHDSLTGLFNRRRFGEELARESARALRYPESGGALLLADLDNVKYVNDKFGHRAGDELIVGVARVLARRVRDTDVLARLGGDEFAIVLPHTKLDAAWLVGRALRDAVREHVTVVEGQKIRTSLSIGVAPLGGGMSGEDSMAVADMAMYEAKKRGRDRVVTFREEPAHLRAALGWAERLRDALADGHFCLYAQPVMDLASGRANRHELLLRLREADASIVLPREFIGTAERFGLINEIDRWVVREAVRLLAAREGSIFSINVSGLSIADPTLLTLIDSELAAAGVDPARLVLELGETAALADLEASRQFVAGLRRIGCGAALDDFGAGFGSFACLRHLPVDFVKIDGEFVRGLPGDEHDRLLVGAIVDVGRGLGIRTIAEEVGSAAALAMLREQGVDFAQGYHIGRPRRLAEPDGA